MRLVVALGAALFFCSWPLKAKEVPFSELRALALQGNSAIRVDKLRQEQSREDIERAKWALAPQTNLTISRGHLAYRGDQVIGATNSLDQTLSLRWRLFDGLKSLRALDMAELSVLEVELELFNQQQSVSHQLAQFYIAWQAAQAKKTLQEEIRAIRKKVYDDVAKRRRQGEIDTQEKVLFENQLIESEERLIQTANELREAIVGINTLTGQIALDADSALPQRTPIFPAEKCEPENLKTTTKELKSLKRLTTKKEKATLAAENAKWSYTPQLDFRADYNLGDQALSPNERGNVRLLLQLNWELFTGHSSHYDLQKTRREIKQVELDIEQLGFATDLAAEDVCRKITANYQRLQQTARITANNERIYQLAQRQFNNGEISALDLITFQANLVTTQLSSIELDATQQRLHLQLDTLLERL